MESGSRGRGRIRDDKIKGLVGLKFWVGVVIGLKNDVRSWGVGIGVWREDKRGF